MVSRPPHAAHRIWQPCIVFGRPLGTLRWLLLGESLAVLPGQRVVAASLVRCVTTPFSK